MEVGASFRPLVTMLNGEYSAQQVVDRFAQNGQNPQSQGPVAAFAQRALKQGAQDLLMGLLRQGFLVARDSDVVACDETAHLSFPKTRSP